MPVQRAKIILYRGGYDDEQGTRDYENARFRSHFLFFKKLSRQTKYALIENLMYTFFTKKEPVFLAEAQLFLFLNSILTSFQP